LEIGCGSGVAAREIATGRLSFRQSAIQKGLERRWQPVYLLMEVTR